MDRRRQTPLGMPERREQPLDTLEREIDEPWMEPREPLQNAVAAQEAASARGSRETTGAGGAVRQSRSRSRANVS